jgi:hypothetical protein
MNQYKKFEKEFVVVVLVVVRTFLLKFTYNRKKIKNNPSLKMNEKSLRTRFHLYSVKSATHDYFYKNHKDGQKLRYYLE